MKRALLVLPVLVLAIGVRARADDEWTKNYTVKGTPVVVLRSNDAHIKASASSQSSVSARLVVKGFSRNDYEVRESQSGDRVEIEVRLLPREGRLDWGNRSLGLEVTMPPQGNLEIRTDDGHVQVAGLSGQIRVHTGDGHIEAHNLSGTLDFETNDGHIDMDHLNGSLRAHTGDGHMSVEGRFDDLDVETGDGHVTLRVEDGSTMKQNWSIRSGDGGIQLELPRSFTADLDASTGDGTVRVNLAEVGAMQTDKDRHHVSAKLGGGGRQLTVRTGDGGITLRQR
jgi:translation initiation factor IF-1